ncbi:MAG: V-type ATP synthase subunit F [Anaerolineaceae bacterium]|nr:V-type ATP synthase subunit F [Anaerolineaceae bacterium]
MKLLVIGHADAVLGFSLVGVAGLVAANADQVNQALDQALARDDAGIILVTDDVAALIEERMNQLRMHSTVPLVVEIPAPEGFRPERPSLREIVMRAIGVKI